jgi:hypothetical protein
LWNLPYRSRLYKINDKEVSELPVPVIAKLGL